MKSLVLVVLLVVATFVCADDSVFGGIRWYMTTAEVRSCLHTLGFVIDSEKVTNATPTIVADGQLFGFKRSTVAVYFSARGAEKIVLMVYTANDLSSMLHEFDLLKDVMQKKYGAPAPDLHFCESPYSLGDGYESLALASDKYNRFAAWKFDNGQCFTLTIDKSFWVKVTYDSPTWGEHVDKVKAKLAETL